MVKLFKILPVPTTRLLQDHKTGLSLAVTCHMFVTKVNTLTRDSRNPRIVTYHGYYIVQPFRFAMEYLIHRIFTITLLST
jgi:hypothetical protein